MIEKISLTEIEQGETYQRLFTANDISLRTLNLETYKLKVEPNLPCYLTEETSLYNFEQIKKALVLYFAKQDLIEAAKSHHPLIAYDLHSPKHNEFRNFKSRIQCLFGSNKSGKSGAGSAKVGLIGLGELPQFPFKPKPNEHLYGWMCSETRALIEETPLKELKKWLRTDQYKEEYGNGGKVERIIIYADNGGQTHIELKPYEAGVKAFESSNLHFVWCDEPPNQRILEAIWARLTAYSGWLLITATTVQPDSKYLREMIAGEGPLAHLRALVDIDSIEMTVWDNKTLSKRQIDQHIAMYAPGSAMYKIRVLGQYADVEGLVFPNFSTHNLDDNDKSITWNVYEPGELDSKMKQSAVRFDLSDYGRDDPFTYLSCYLTEEKLGNLVDYTWWIDAEIYQSGLEALQQGELIKRRIEEHGKPVIIVGDDQITRKQAQGKRIVDYYQEANPDFQLPFRALHKDKKDPAIGLTALSDWVTRVNKITGKPRFRVNIRCGNTIKEFGGLLWKPSNDYSTSKEGVTKGKDHCVDPCRYAVVSGLLENGALYKHYAPNKPKRVYENAYY